MFFCLFNEIIIDIIFHTNCTYNEVYSLGKFHNIRIAVCQLLAIVDLLTKI